MQTGASIGLPHAYSEVVRAADDKASVELYTPHCRLVAVKQTNAFASFNVPHTERGIARPAYHSEKNNKSYSWNCVETIKTIVLMLKNYQKI